ncbi:MAG: phospho-N-acetylmuramoyl-pentapeptide-transferase [Elusimicrobiota bacterium]
MLYHLLFPLKDLFFPFNVLQYITFRTAGAFITSLTVSFIFAPKLIRMLKNRKKLQIIREDGPQRHHEKEGTPTMGGIIIILSLVLSALLWCKLNNDFIIILFISTIWLGIIGLADDYLSVYKNEAEGFSPTVKLVGQLLLGLGLAAYLYYNPTFKSQPYSLTLPFMKNTFLNLGILYIPFVMITVVGTSNAVNITDGLDGLAIGCIIFASLTYAALSYIAGNIEFSSYLFLPYVKGAGEMTVYLAALAGAGFGFLWYNIFPAQVFMGDTASLFMGGVLGVSALLIKQEILLIIVGGVFLIEILSVMIQVTSYKWKGKRVFKMAPLHHHFELKGWSEPQVVIRFWIIAIMLCFLALATLKLR